MVSVSQRVVGTSSYSTHIASVFLSETHEEAHVGKMGLTHLIFFLIQHLAYDRKPFRWFPLDHCLYSSEHTTCIWNCLSWFHNYCTNSLYEQIITNKISPILFSHRSNVFSKFCLWILSTIMCRSAVLRMLWYTLHVKLLWVHPEDCQLSQVQKALFKLENQRATVVLTATETCVS